METSEAVSRIFVGTGRNLFLSTLRSAIETIPPTPQPELAQPEGAAPAPPAGSPLPALIQNPAAPLRAVKQSAKEQAVAQSPTLESKTATLALAMPLALPVVSLGLQDSRSLPAPDSSEVYNVPDQSGTHAPRFGNDVVAVSGTDVERDATQLPAPVAFQLDLIATPALPIKEHPGSEAPALPNVSKTADRSPRPDLTALLLSAGASTLAINPATSSTFLQSPALAQISLPAQPGPAPQASSSVSQFLSTVPDIAAPTPESAASRPGSVPPPDPQVLSPSTGTAAPTAESAISRPGVAEMSTMTASAEKLDALVRSNAPAESFLRPAISASDRYLDSAAVSGSTASQPAISDAHGNKPFESDWRLRSLPAPYTR